MFNVIKNLFNPKTDSERLSEATFDKKRYQIIKLETGKYGYNDMCDNGTVFYRSPNLYESLEEVIDTLEWKTKTDKEFDKINSLKAEVIS